MRKDHPGEGDWGTGGEYSQQTKYVKTQRQRMAWRQRYVGMAGTPSRPGHGVIEEPGEEFVLHV